MGRKTVGLVGLWDCVAFDEVAGINFKDKDGIQIMEFYDVIFSCIDLEDMSEHYVSVPEQGSGKLIPGGMCNPGQVYTISQGKSGIIGVFRLESQMLLGNGKLERTGLESDRNAKESSNTAFNFLKANGNRISGFSPRK